MVYAILAAGLGERLQQEGATVPKPLIEIGGRTLLERLISIFQKQGAEQIFIIVNDLREKMVFRYLEGLIKRNHYLNVQVVVKSTADSMQSFAALAPFIKGRQCCLTTVDAIFHVDEFEMFMARFEQTDCDALMAVTDYVDDEKPLYAQTDEHLRITAFLDERKPGVAYVSGGIYAMRSRCFDTLERCLKAGKKRMRNFQRGLLEDELKVEACPFSKILDIDHKADVEKAIDFCKGEPPF